MEKIKAKLEALKPQIKTFWSSEDEWNKYMAAGDYDIAVYWSGSAARSQEGDEAAGRIRRAEGRGDRLV